MRWTADCVYDIFKAPAEDDYVLMNKAAVNSDIYEKNSLDLRYVLYKYGEKLLQEPERLLQVKEFLYNSPELQHIYMIPKEEIEEADLLYAVELL